jgi:hypothetical protein
MRSPCFGGQWRELTVIVRRIHRHLGWPCVGGGDSTSWLWGFKSEGGTCALTTRLVLDAA